MFKNIQNKDKVRNKSKDPLSQWSYYGALEFSFIQQIFIDQLLCGRPSGNKTEEDLISKTFPSEDMLYAFCDKMSENTGIRTTF